MKKKYKIVESELFKKQKKKLPPDVKKKLPNLMKKLAENPEKLPHSMSVFGPPSPEELKQWMGRTRADTIDLVMEYLFDKDCLKKKGRDIARNFWQKYIREEQK